MKEYIKQLIKFVNSERDAEIQLMLNEIKKLSPKKREDLGRAINKVKGKNLGRELGFNIVQFGRKKTIDTEINVGDIVLVSIGNPLKSDLTGTVTEKGNRFIKIAFDNNLPKWALKKEVRLDLYANDVTFRRMEENLANLSIKGKDALEYILKKRDPQKSDEKLLNKEYDFIDKSLNESQKKAVREAIASKNFFLIHGPFGTGKTRTLIELIKQEAILKDKILVTAESNNAVDNILERLSENNEFNITRLGHPQRVDKENITYSLAYKVENHPSNEKIKELHDEIDKLSEKRSEHTKPTPQFRRGYSDSEIYRLGVQRKGGRGISPSKMNSMAKWLEINKKIEDKISEIKMIEEKIVEEIIDKSSIILATNSSAALESIANIKFDVSIIDEASQATIPSVLIPIAKANKFILAGDHKQLPPTIISKKAKPLEDTLFEKLIEMYPEKSQLLDTQYRMNNSLMEFPNIEFYKGKLSSDESVNDILIEDILSGEKLSENCEIMFEDQLLSNESSLIFIDTSNVENNNEKQLKDSKSIINKTESEIILEIANFYNEMGVSKGDIGIISPYLDQVNLIKNKTPIDVKTVDGFQGREKEIILISTVRSNNKGNIGFLSDLRRLNVALTRAKRKLIIIGNKDTLKSNNTYKRLIKFCSDKNCLIEI